MADAGNEEGTQKMAINFGVQKLLKFGLISSFALVLSGCFKFEQPPFPEDSLQSIEETKFGKEVLKIVGNLDDDSGPTKAIKESFDPSAKVLVIDDDFLVSQSKKEGRWEVEVLMKNSSHILFCAIFEDDKIKIPDTIKIQKKKEMGFSESTVSGSGDDLKKFALELVSISPKICLGIPLKRFGSE